jgi:hypothetical protein
VGFNIDTHGYLQSRCKLVVSWSTAAMESEMALLLRGFPGQGVSKPPRRTHDIIICGFKYSILKDPNFQLFLFGDIARHQILETLERCSLRFSLQLIPEKEKGSQRLCENHGLGSLEQFGPAWCAT